MSIFSTVIKDLKSFSAKVEAAFKKLFGAAPSWIVIAQGVLTYLGPIVVTILTIGGGPALGDEANQIIGDNQDGSGDGAGDGEHGECGDEPAEIAGGYSDAASCAAGGSEGKQSIGCGEH